MDEPEPEPEPEQPKHIVILSISRKGPNWTEDLENGYMYYHRTSVAAIQHIEPDITLIDENTPQGLLQYTVGKARRQPNPIVYMGRKGRLTQEDIRACMTNK